MKRRSPNNYRVVAWLLMVVLIVLTLPSGATWQCLDGSLCPANCPMRTGKPLHSPVSLSIPLDKSGDIKSDLKSDLQSNENEHCSLCLPHHTDSLFSGKPVPKMSSQALLMRACAHATSRCVLRFSERPASTVEQGVSIHAPLLALPPPALNTCTVTARKPQSLRHSTPYPTPHPSRHLYTTSGRAPPHFC